MAFASCQKLESVIIQDGATSIGFGAFSHCENLELISIPDSVTDINNYAFHSCEKLTIECSAGSYAEQYAKENCIKFKTIKPQQ